MQLFSTDLNRPIGTLRVLIQEGNKYTEIWRVSKNQNNKWIQATVDIGRVAKPIGRFRSVENNCIFLQKSERKKSGLYNYF
jgi:hypothetical protein